MLRLSGKGSAARGRGSNERETGAAALARTAAPTREGQSWQGAACTALRAIDERDAVADTCLAGTGRCVCICMCVCACVCVRVRVLAVTNVGEGRGHLGEVRVIKAQPVLGPGPPARHAHALAAIPAAEGGEEGLRRAWQLLLEGGHTMTRPPAMPVPLPPSPLHIDSPPQTM